MLRALNVAYFERSKGLTLIIRALNPKLDVKLRGNNVDVKFSLANCMAIPNCMRSDVRLKWFVKNYILFAQFLLNWPTSFMAYL